MADTKYLVKKNEQLQLAINELRVLNDIATTITSTQPVEVIIDQIVLKCIKHLEVEEGTISLLGREEFQDEFHTMIRRLDSSAEQVPIKLDNRLKGWMLKERKILFSNDIRSDDRFKYLSADSYSFKSIISVPLIVKGDLIGYLAVFNKKNGLPFTKEDQRLLSIIGSQSAQVIENARLYEEEKALLSLQEEMRMAWKIQCNLLPDHPPEIPGYQISATNIPAKAVGGDYYDFLPLPSEKIGFCVGDITGKGMPAAMLMANLQATFKSQVMNFTDCCKCIESTSTLLFKSTESTKFATLFYGILDPENDQLEYVNGGHDAPILFRDDHHELLESTGLLLGIMDQTVYSKGTVSLKPDDVLLLYTDGITEAMDSDSNEFGLERLIFTAKKNLAKSAQEIQQTILEDVRNHANKTPQSDDITLMIIKRS